MINQLKKMKKLWKNYKLQIKCNKIMKRKFKNGNNIQSKIKNKQNNN